MANVVFRGRNIRCRPSETVLDALLRAGESAPFSCRAGACLGCLQRAVSGDPGPASQRQLNDGLRRLGYFLPCRCVPTDDLVLEPARPEDLYTRAVIVEKQHRHDVCVLRLDPFTTFSYRAGQFVNVRRPDGLVRSYSLAGVAAEDPYLEIHVKRHETGEMSRWLVDHLDSGDEIDLQGPNGRCYYVPGSQEQNLLLIANGTGAAPLYGITREALLSGHRGTIRFYHGSHTAAGLYLHDELTRMAEQYPNFRYFGCVSGPDAPAGFNRGRANRVAFAQNVDLRGTRVYVAGLREMVADVQTVALRLGASPAEVHADPYDYAAPSMLQPSTGDHAVTPADGAGDTATTEVAEGSGRRSLEERPEADPEMWAALGEGVLLEQILTDFYARVFDDAVLAPYFRGVTRERLIGQVFSYMRDLFTGQQRYFGMRPRTAHHWMVISDAIFDHREALMEDCLRRHGLAEPLIERWRRVEERFRGDIVKAAPWKLVVNGIEMPLDGFGHEELLAGSMCDGCEREIDPGERVRYHLRLGLTYCGDCTAEAGN